MEHLACVRRYCLGVAVPGDLWFPHVLEPNQDPNSDSGASLFGRWDYGPWFWPAQPIAALTANPPVEAPRPCREKMPN